MNPESLASPTNLSHQRGLADPRTLIDLLAHLTHSSIDSTATRDLIAPLRGSHGCAVAQVCREIITWDIEPDVARAQT